MQFPQTTARTQLPLFHAALLTSPPAAPCMNAVETPWTESVESFSELTLSGSTENCLLLLAPVLRELSQQAGDRWLTLVDAPAQLTQAWLRKNGLKRETILLLQSRGTQTAVELVSEALRLGRSHTVVSWINQLGAHSRQKLTAAALQGQTQSLNICLS
ncbi:SOS-induced cell division inhibitor SulA [Pseudomonas sp. N040]|uniref:SOS-induced cell division inhibitor SulA n=1 Tax=Pseudomonas sp. N040 TaxID=2785325 RepID=UPI0018A2C969|nr:SOS-induced cell division inhibitor SulA [Pseudomonas sp. N040]MBF7731297.1 CDP-glycerol--UDP-pyrophosphoryl-N-acetylglucosaminyl-N-acetylmannosamine glycerophosphotransferase [Pseudomonas sp. N040]MBW7014940.1 CDP-glycerol--UDP-pyrophosphoryl-N-acetylglucosaminyl-N-acetylmannosamine glycerophosphotransferase [Pseudomonas sp. N040]